MIEIDGKIHDYQQEYDQYQTHFINSLGISVVRFRNGEIEEKIVEVLEKLKHLMSI